MRHHSFIMTHSIQMSFCSEDSHNDNREPTTHSNPCDLTHSCAWHDAFIYVTWRIFIRDMTHSYTWHDAFIYVTWRIHVRDMTHSYTWHDAFMCVTWRIHIHRTTHSYMQHVSDTRMTWLIHSWRYVAVCCSVLQCVVARCSALQCEISRHQGQHNLDVLICFWHVLQRVAACCSDQSSSGTTKCF